MSSKLKMHRVAWDGPQDSYGNPSEYLSLLFFVSPVNGTNEKQFIVTVMTIAANGVPAIHRHIPVDASNAHDALKSVNEKIEAEYKIPKNGFQHIEPLQNLTD
ncbi:hypothetical protein [Oceanicaulis sp.]|uniref:hypothetical protein n=1 Tax=Oceanicaulis sp. TaxID=1924941 RepID=UPI003F6FD969